MVKRADWLNETPIGKAIRDGGCQDCVVCAKRAKMTNLLSAASGTIGSRLTAVRRCNLGLRILKHDCWEAYHTEVQYWLQCIDTRNT